MSPNEDTMAPDEEKTLWRFLRISWWAILMVRGYQCFISPMLGQNCRFEPTCSEYYILAVKKYGFIRGSLKGAWRILRCNPFCKGGEDPP